MPKNMRSVRAILVFMLTMASLMSCKHESNKTVYLKYTPQKDSVFRIIFEYPNAWKWTVQEDDFQVGSGLMTTTNPSITIDDNNSRDGLSPDIYKGSVGVYANSFESADAATVAMETEIFGLLETGTVIKAELLSDRVFEIDGYIARRITTKLGPRIMLVQYEPLISENIFILVNNAYYNISFEIVENERFSEFGQGFDHMVENIKFIP